MSSNLNLDLTETAMLRPSTFGCPDDFTSLIDFPPPLWYTPHQVWLSTLLQVGFWIHL
jgi:hypothetical protein